LINYSNRSDILYIVPILLQLNVFTNNEYFSISLLIPSFIVVFINYIIVLITLLGYLMNLKELTNTLVFMSVEFIKLLGLSCVIMFLLIGISGEIGSIQVDFLFTGILLVILGNCVKFTEIIFSLNDFSNNGSTDQLNIEIKEPLLLDA
jgi:hypothetical protein